MVKTDLATTPMLAVHYKCSCMKEEAIFDMPARHDDEDVVAFMQRVQKWCGEDHQLRSPFCMAEKMEYLKLPLQDGKPMGAA